MSYSGQTGEPSAIAVPGSGMERRGARVGRPGIVVPQRTEASRPHGMRSTIPA